MKKTISSMLVLLGLSASAVVMAEGSVKKSTIINDHNAKNQTNVAIGKDVAANQNTIKISGDVEGSTIVNKSNAKNQTNVGIGEGVEANQNSVLIGK